MYPFAYSSSSSSSPPHSVDCTLSLATPSTRLTQDDDHRRHFTTWDFFQNETTSHYQPGTPADHVQADNHPVRRCANCHTTSTPLWRNGPRGPKSLCNACGIRFKKEERRANGNGHRGNASSTRMDQRGWAQPESLQYFSPATGFQLADDDDHDQYRNSEQLTAFRWFGGGY